MAMAAAANVDPAELAKFQTQAHSFWDPAGAFRTLHAINPVRVQFIAARATLKGARIADVGCGGGALSEALAAHGAQVIGVDLSEAMIEVARLHAAASGLPVDYQLLGAETLAAQQPHSFDVVTCMELIEHVPDPPGLVAALATLLRPGGLLFMSTINRTPQAFALAIVAAEYVLGLVPRGTHEYARFIRPAELSALARDAGLTLSDLTGVRYDPLTNRCESGHDPQVNYMACFAAAGARD
jgi:2-polyprenyl-6-hydroxyphenyl methylase / 3-demethylubiquinone-9 3-methyltransferase